MADRSASALGVASKSGFRDERGRAQRRLDGERRDGDVRQGGRRDRSWGAEQDRRFQRGEGRSDRKRDDRTLLDQRGGRPKPTRDSRADRLVDRHLDPAGDHPDPRLDRRAELVPAGGRDIAGDKSRRTAATELTYPENSSITGGAAHPSRALTTAERTGLDERTRDTRARLRQAGLAESAIDRAAEHLALGWPSPASAEPDDYLVAREQYVLSYNRSKTALNWAAWKVSKSDLGETSRTKKFRADDTLPREWDRAFRQDYRGSGYTRGHIVASGERTADRETNRETFILSNAVPQTYDSNAGAWHTFERYYRDLAQVGGKDVYLVAGPVWGAQPERIGHGDGVAVPDAVWKVAVVVDRGKRVSDLDANARVIAVVVPNDGRTQLNDTFEKFRVAPSEIEKLTGLRLFDALPEPVRQDLLSKVDREPVKVHYFTKWKIGDLKRRGLALPRNAMLDPTETIGPAKPRSRPSLPAIAMPRLFERSTPSAQPSRF